MQVIAALTAAAALAHDLFLGGDHDAIAQRLVGRQIASLELETFLALFSVIPRSRQSSSNSIL